MEGRIPPHSLEAEQSVLGAILLDYQVLDEIEGLLPTPEAFYAEAHRKIYAAMQSLRAEGAPVDLVTLAEELSRRGELDGVGGISYLMQLSEATPTAAYAEHYARIVAEKWTLRRLIQAMDRIGFWFAVAAILVVLAYGPTLVQLFSHLNPVPGWRLW